MAGPGSDLAVRAIEEPAELDRLEPLWLALHRHHRAILPPGTLVADDAAAWARRRAVYCGWMEDGVALVLVAERAGEPAGYAVAHLQDGPDDTFAVGDRYAELYSLSVAPSARGAGVGTQLMDELDRRLATLGIADLAVAVMSDNRDALRFYERRGLRPTETYLWRIDGA